MFANIAKDFADFLQAPIRGNMDIFSVFLAVGLVIVFIMLWSRVISHLASV